jgi:hypothetical protein
MCLGVWLLSFSLVSRLLAVYGAMSYVWLPVRHTSGQKPPFHFALLSAHETLKAMENRDNTGQK